MIQALERGKYYHIYNRGINSGILFKEKTNFEYFLQLYQNHIDPIAVTYAWCLMKNHFHFIIKLKEADEIDSLKTINPSQSFSNLFNAYTKAYNKKYSRTGTLFERPFKRIEINNTTYLNHAIVYVHNNPVHHLVCEHPLEYPWSSYVSIVSNQPTKMHKEKVIALFDGTENFIKSHQNVNNNYKVFTQNEL